MHIINDITTPAIFKPITKLPQWYTLKTYEYLFHYNKKGLGSFTHEYASTTWIYLKPQ